MKTTTRIPVLLSLLTLAVAPLLQTKCRYKDNDKLVVQTAYKRLCKTWILKSAVVESTGVEILDSIKVLRNRSLHIERGKANNEVMLNSDPEPLVKCILDQNKTRIYRYNNESEGSLKIIKLTKDELWMRGYPIASVLGGGGEPNEITTFRYQAEN